MIATPETVLENISAGCNEVKGSPTIEISAKVGISIATFNSGPTLCSCLDALMRSDYNDLSVCIIDSGSSDGSIESIQDRCKRTLDLEIISVGPENWWTAATNRGIERCLSKGCGYVLLLNPDVVVQPGAISCLVKASASLGNAIVSPVVLIFGDPDLIWEAGHSWGHLGRFLPFVWTSRYLYKHRTPASRLPTAPYPAVTVIGRGGLMPRKAFERLGLFDEVHFPHYGADSDMAIRAYRYGYPMFIVPQAQVHLHVHQTGKHIPTRAAMGFQGYLLSLTSRKHGEAARVLYYWYTNNLPWNSAIPSYIYSLALHSFRYWQDFAFARKALH